jgi:hypothetical protein
VVLVILVKQAEVRKVILIVHMRKVSWGALILDYVKGGTVKIEKPR